MKSTFGSATLVVCCLGMASTSQAQETLFGYQLGVVQGSAAGHTNDPFQFIDNMVMVDNVAESIDSRFTGYQFTTQITGNLTLDIPGRLFEQSFLIGASLDQLIPYAVPEDTREELQTAPIGIIANGNYLIRHVRPTYGLALNLGYAFVKDGRLSNAPGGASAGISNNTIPGASSFGGLLTVTDNTHTANAEAQLEITRQNWDLSVRPAYVYTDNGVFNLLDAGAPGGANADGLNVGAVACRGFIASTGTTAPGCFVLAEAHDISLNTENRIRLARRHNLNSELAIQWFIPEVPENVAQPLEETLITEFNSTYLYNRRAQQNFGLSVNAEYGMRTPQDPFPADIEPEDRSDIELIEDVRPDTLIYGASLVYNDRFRALELNLALELGVAQATLFQPPIGALPPAICPLTDGCEANPESWIIFTTEDFSPIRAQIEPQLRLTLERDFEPFNLELVALREIGLGALGASALITTGGAFNLRHLWRRDDGEAVVTNLGLTYARLKPVGQDLFLGFDPVDLEQLSAQLENEVFGLNLVVAMPLFEIGDILFDANFNYTFAHVNQDPTEQLRAMQTGDQALENEVVRVGNIGPPIPLEPTQTHLGVLAIRGTWGRGSLQTGRGGGGGGGGPPRDQYGQDPRTGGPLGSARLIGEGEPLLDGTAGRGPGRRPEATSRRERFERSQRQKLLDKKSSSRGKLLNSNKTAQEEKEDAQKEEEKKQKEAKEKRTRDFGEWPVKPPEKEEEP